MYRKGNNKYKSTFSAMEYGYFHTYKAITIINITFCQHKK